MKRQQNKKPKSKIKATKSKANKNTKSKKPKAKIKKKRLNSTSQISEKRHSAKTGKATSTRPRKSSLETPPMSHQENLLYSEDSQAENEEGIMKNKGWSSQTDNKAKTRKSIRKQSVIKSGTRSVNQETRHKMGRRGRVGSRTSS